MLFSLILLRPYCIAELMFTGRDSMFSVSLIIGMKPVMFSIQEALSGRPFWFRTGSNICYYKNCYTRTRTKSYFTASFQITFPHGEDICYLAYHFPYTYSTLMVSYDVCFSLLLFINIKLILAQGQMYGTPSENHIHYQWPSLLTITLCKVSFVSLCCHLLSFADFGTRPDVWDTQ